IYHPAAMHTEQMHDVALAALHNFMRELCGTSFTPTDVHVGHRRAQDDVHHRNTFRVRARFNAEYSALRFPSSWMQRPANGAAPARHAAAERLLEAAEPADIVQRVMRAVRLVLLHGRSSGDDVAQMLSMHRRTLNRHLKARGTTFQHLLDTVRFTVAGQ